MERQRAPHPALPILLFIMMIGASVTVIILWWYQAHQSPLFVRADASPSAPMTPDTRGTDAPHSATAAVGGSGRLDVTSDPVGATVTVNGVHRGRTPLVVDSLTPGRYTVAITSGSTTIRRNVTVTSGGMTTVMASVVPARPEAGWVAIDMPFEAEILERGRVLGTTASPRIALPPGAHDLELRNTGLGFSETLGVQVVAGQTVRPTVNAPTGLVFINALPWAEVIIDGRSVGTTPLANLPVGIGTHTVVLKHPTLGERRHTINVVEDTPLRLGVSFEE
jgi:hypothetical protein